jgi:hypothetical protein
MGLNLTGVTVVCNLHRDLSGGFEPVFSVICLAKCAGTPTSAATLMLNARISVVIVCFVCCGQKLPTQECVYAGIAKESEPRSWWQETSCRELFLLKQARLLIHL